MTALPDCRPTAPGRECEVSNGSFAAFYSRNLGLADRLLCGKLADRNGSRRDRHLFELIAGKQSVEFRCLKAACRDQVFPTRNGQWVSLVPTAVQEL